MADCSGGDEADEQQDQDDDLDCESEAGSQMSDGVLGEQLAVISLLHEMEQSVRQRGTVQKFAPKRGFGLIQPEQGGDLLFAHWTQIRSEDSWPQLSPGMTVEFVVDKKSKKPTALDISAVGGGLVTGPADTDKESRQLSDEVFTGTVSFFHHAGYGFIFLDSAAEWPCELPAGSKIFVSREDLVIAAGSVCSLAEGTRVQFKLYKPPGREVAAAEVTAIGGAPLVGSSVKPQTFSKGRGKGKPGIVLRSQAAGVQRSIQKPVRKYFGEAHASTTATATTRCKFFDQGCCSKGDACPFLHDSHDPFPETVTVVIPSDPAELDRLLLETLSAAQDEQPVPASVAAPPHASGNGVPCRFFAEGRCRKGLACPFSHVTQVSHVPLVMPSVGMQESLAAVIASQPAASSSTTSKVPCKFFADGLCTKGAACNFSHDMANAQPQPGAKIAKECTFFAQGRCTRGDACAYAHGPQELFELQEMRQS
eukprot:TRINITY_DN64000_c0_g1_i1.p1 TRINITY_DN64000_c0_g1~~TRINITY_DN64000_c0_g1_i1.p1  ORF type:complete len:505 (-),score=65.39 TRINITY_DN64000_c0_g1_i1:19-1458(-)